jgi:hypothetical protein
MIKLDYLRPRIESFNTIFNTQLEKKCNLSLKKLLLKEKQNSYTFEM